MTKERGIVHDFYIRTIMDDEEMERLYQSCNDGTCN